MPVTILQYCKACNDVTMQYCKASRYTIRVTVVQYYKAPRYTMRVTIVQYYKAPRYTIRVTVVQYYNAPRYSMRVTEVQYCEAVQFPKKNQRALSVAEQWGTVILPTNLWYCPWHFVAIDLHTHWKFSCGGRR